MSHQLSHSWQLHKPAVISDRGLVCAQTRVAAEAGAEVLRAGGSAVDAAIATSFALGASEPWMSGIGGGGYMLIQRAGESGAEVIDFGMRAPRRLNPADYPLSGRKGSDLFAWPEVLGNRNIKGASAVAIPGQVAGMALAHQRHARMPWQTLLLPSIELAREGLLVDWYCQLVLAGAASDLVDCPQMRAHFFDTDGFPKAISWAMNEEKRCHFENLANTLEQLSMEGGDSFYHGAMAESLVRDLQQLGGVHTIEDFQHYQARALRAETFRYREHQVHVVPGLTAGPTLRHVFQHLEQHWQANEVLDARAYQAMEAAIRVANQQRFEQMGDGESPEAPGCTTHFNVVDQEGTLVSVTQTLLSLFGARVILPESGIIMNNGIMWFDPEPGKPNSLGPNKRCLSNMCPTLLQRGDGARFALGAAGGRKIMPAVAQLSAFMLDYNMSVEQAMHTPKLEVSTAQTRVDANVAPSILSALQAHNPSLRSQKRTVYPFAFASPSMISVEASGNRAVTELGSPWADSVAQ